MAKFNPEVPAEGQNYLGYSRGQESNDALGVLFKGAANVVEGAATVADNHVQGNIRRDITREYDAANDSFGIDAYAVSGGSSTGPGTSTPAEINQAKRWLGTLNNAFMSGEVKESHFAMRMEQKVKDLRNRYPGYREQIDAIVADVTGMTPANKLREQLFNEFEAERKALQTQADDFDKKVVDWTDSGILAPALGQRWMAGERGEDLKQEIVENMSHTAYERASQTAANARMDGQAKVGTLRKEEADQEMLRRVNTSLSAMTDNGFKTIAPNFSALMTKIQSSNGQDIIPKEEIPAMLAELGRVKVVAAAELRRIQTQPWGDSGSTFADTTSTEAQERAQKMLDLTFKQYEEAITNNQYGLIKLNAASNEAARDAGMRDLINDFPAVIDIEAMGKMNAGAMFDKILLESELGSSMATVMEGRLMAGLGTGEIVTVDDAVKQARQRTGDDPKMVNQLITDIEKFIQAEESPAQLSENTINAMFGEENNGFLNQIHEDQRLKLFQRLTSPKMTERITELSKANPELLDQYARWSVDNFSNLFKEKRDSILQIFEAADGEAEVILDPDSGELEVIYTGQRQPNETLSDALARQQVYEFDMQSNLRDLNTYFKSLKPIVEASGDDFVDVAKIVFKGIDLDLDAEEGEDRSEPLTGGQMADDVDGSSGGDDLRFADDIDDDDFVSDTPELSETMPDLTASDAPMQYASPVKGVDINNLAQVPLSGGSPGSRSFGGRRGKNRLHTGVDIPGKNGDPVQATGRGVVRRSGTGQGYGTVVDVEYPDGTVHRYAHLGSAKVNVGDTVEPGQLLGTVGHSGNADASFPHVHYEVIKKDYYDRNKGRPAGRAKSKQELAAGRLDPRTYFK